ncbi:MAG: urea ABC transporter permease subunit UrtC [Cyanobacteria bacterium Co-bin13]|nr:urea ABC transporter permease subunit UrtC [Cyanobacteria bacterium Co-bin13]
MNLLRIRRFMLSPYTLLSAAILIVPLFVVDPFWINRLGLYLVFSILALSMALCWGQAGILSLGHGAFFGLGAYCMAMSLKLLSPDSLNQGTPFPLPDFITWNTPPGEALKLPWLWVPFQNLGFGMAAALLVPALFAAVVGWFVFYGGVSGVFISIITLALVVILNLVVIDQQPITNGFNGLNNLAPFDLAGVVFDPYGLPAYYLIAGICVLLLLGLRWLGSTRAGLLFRAVQADEQRVQYFGYDVAVYKIFAFSLSALIAGLAGLLFVVNSQYASPTIMDVSISIAVVVWTAVGGRQSLIGAVLGALAINGAQNALSESGSLVHVWQLIIGIVFVLVVVFLPRGLAGLGADLWQHLRPQAKAVEAPALVAEAELLSVPVPQNSHQSGQRQS